jgi:hypothetical protein
MQEQVFPLYRRYSGTQTWFEVLSPSVFRELKIMPHGFSFSYFEARILPDRNYLHDLITLSQPGIVAVDVTEFLQALSHAQSHLKEIKI